MAKRSYEYQKSKHFSNALKDSSVYVYLLHTWSDRFKTRWQRDPLLICPNVL